VPNLFAPRATVYYFYCTRGPKTKLSSELSKVKYQKPKRNVLARWACTKEILTHTRTHAHTHTHTLDGHMHKRLT